MSNLNNLNVINLVGRAGSDPEIKIFESGASVAKFSIAVRRRSKNSSPDWFPLELWGKTAEVAGNYVRKGSLIGITGELKINEWTNQTTGEIQYKPVIQVNNLHLLSPKSDNNSSSNTEGIPKHENF